MHTDLGRFKVKKYHDKLAVNLIITTIQNYLSLDELEVLPQAPSFSTK